VLRAQRKIIDQLLSGTTLTRMHDAELRTAADADVLTTAELLQRLTKTIFSEVESTKEGDYTNRKPAISSLRRNLQRTYLEELVKLALGSSSAPEDCQTMAYSELANLQQRIKSLLDNQPVASKLTYSRAFAGVVGSHRQGHGRPVPNAAARLHVPIHHRPWTDRGGVSTSVLHLTPLAPPG
jgi:hypothetical protein